MKDLILKWALKNAVDHDGKAVAGFVINKVIGENSDLKKDMKKLAAEVNNAVKEVNKMEAGEQKKKLLGIWPTALEKRVEERKLPDLPGDTSHVVLRFAPNPSGPLHIGHARTALLNWFYKEKYDGEYILRFDDTDPKVKPPMKEAYDWIIKDLKWLGIAPDKIIYASDRFDLYFDYAKKLIGMGEAYVCDCEAEKWREMKAEGIACNCRSLSPKENVKRWGKMFSGYREEEAVLRIKTDIKHPNPAIRDWVAFRIVDKPQHPRVKSKVWPMLNFASCIDDHLLKVSHIIRGRDLAFTELQQKYVYGYLGWKYPEVVVNGKLSLEGATMSKTEIKKGIAEGRYSGFDDPALGTLMGLKKRGISAEAIRKVIWDLGVRMNNVNLSWDNVLAAQRAVKNS
jgi:glutamyl-tRNA synthetase